MNYRLHSVDPSDATLYDRHKVRLGTPGVNMIVAEVPVRAVVLRKGE